MKILFSDVDGTLIEKGQAISTKNLDKMKEMQEKGHKIALCTGRNHIDIQPVLNNIEIPYDYLVLCNGSYISDATGKVLFEEHLSKELGTKIIHHLLKDPNIVVAFCYDIGCPVYAKGQTKILGLNIKFSKWEKYNSLPIYIVSNYKIENVNINGVKCLGVSLQDELPTL